jgi:hypothetical protein
VFDSAALLGTPEFVKVIEASVSLGG